MGYGVQQPDTHVSSAASHGERLPWGISRLEQAGLAVLLGLVVVTLGLSWRCWPDPLVDFGRELYIPWRISQGAVLYRDLDHLFGPLSQYFNSLVFRISGPGLMHLVYVNLAIYLLILGLAYTLVRTTWGPLAAFAAASVAICTLSFTQFTATSNYNYACPYAHETTHGIALLLAEVMAAVLWLRRPAVLWAAVIGLCCGLTILTKVEVIFAAACITLTFLVLMFLRYRSGHSGVRSHMVVLAAMVLLPDLIATGAFATFADVSLGRAWRMTNNAWLLPLDHPQMMLFAAERSFLGLDDPAKRAVPIGMWTIGGVIFMAALLWTSSRLRLARQGVTRWAAGCAIVAAFGAAAALVDWMFAGYLLPALLAAGAVLSIRRWYRQEGRAEALHRPSAACGLLLWVLACAMLARMSLNPRIYHYGFYQAFPAVLVSVAVLISLLPRALNLETISRKVYLTAIGGVLLVMCSSILWMSAEAFLLKTEPVGEGADRFYGFAAVVDPTASLVESSRQQIQCATRARSLLVLPEGVMLNYLTRLPGTVPYLQPYLPIAFGEGEGLAEHIRSNPPSHVLLISRDLREYGINRLGASDREGRAVMLELQRGYRMVGQLGGDPLDVGQRGAALFEVRSGDTPHQARE